MGKRIILSDSRKVAILVLAASVARAVAAVSFPMLGGESYYWIWGQRPAAGYYDHPPMAGLMSWTFFGWVHGSQLAARSSAIILAALTTWGLFLLARTLFPEGRTAWRTALLFTLIPIFNFGAVVLGPDNSLAFFLTLTWLLFWMAAERQTSLLLWVAAGLTAGLALLSKFHAWALLPPLYGLLLFSPRHRPCLRTPGPWLAIVIAILVLSPNLIWNAHHGWINYAYQFERSGVRDGGFNPGYPFNLIAGSAITLTPLVFAALVAACWKGFAQWRRTADPVWLYLLLAGVPLPLFLALMSLRVSIALHWPATAYLPLLILAVRLMEQGFLFSPRLQRWMWGTASALTAVAFAAPSFVTRLPDSMGFRSTQDEISIARLKSSMAGWPEIGAVVRRIHDEMSAKGPALVMARGEHLVSALGFYSERPMDCFTLSSGEAHNYSIWMEERGGIQGRDAVVVFTNKKIDQSFNSIEDKYKRSLQYLEPLFERVEIAPSLICYSDGTFGEELSEKITRPRIREFMIFRCYGFRGQLASDED